MEVVFGLIGIFAFIAMPTSLIMMLFAKRRKLGLQIFFASCLALPVFIYGLVGFPTHIAKMEGFLDASDRYQARSAGYSSAEEWGKVREDVLAKKRAERSAFEEQVNKRIADAKAEEQAKADAHKAKLAAKVLRMTGDIAATIRSYYQIEPQPLFPGKPLCREDGYCDFEAASIRVQVYGAGLAVVEATDQVSRTDYIEMCSVVFAAISGANINFAGETVGLAYGAALGSGSYEQDISGVKIDMTTAMSDTPECHFFKYGN